MKKPANINVELTEEQQRELKAHFDFCVFEGNNGRPGMLLAQVGRPFENRMRVSFITNDAALKLLELMHSLGYFADP